MRQVEELKTAPASSAKELLEKELNPGFSTGTSADADAPVNDLTGMVKRKKVKPEAAANGGEASGLKRKADDEADAAASKKARVEDVPDEAA